MTSRRMVALTPKGPRRLEKYPARHRGDDEPDAWMHGNEVEMILRNGQAVKSKLRLHRINSPGRSFLRATTPLPRQEIATEGILGSRLNQAKPMPKKKFSFALKKN